MGSEGAWRSRKDFLHDVAMHVGQAVVAAAEAECQAFVIQAHEVQDRGVRLMPCRRLAAVARAAARWRLARERHRGEILLRQTHAALAREHWSRLPAYV